MTAGTWIVIGLTATIMLGFLIWLTRHPRAGNGLSTSIVNGVWLECIGGSDHGRVWPILKRQVVLGRAAECDVVIGADLVSRHHALISYADGQIVLHDRNSTNGVWVNGRRIAQCPIQSGDQIQIGPDVFILRHADRATPTPEPIPVPSSVLAGRCAVRDIQDFELLDTRPDTGGAAIVYKARWRDTGQLVAVKVLRSSDPYIKDHFATEIKIGKSLCHPHIVQVYGGGNSRGVWYLVMEYVPGGTLRDRLCACLTDGKLLPLDFTLSVAGQVCSALAYAHGRGVVHRDIKPENILFGIPEIAKLGDFGIARLAQTVTRTAYGVLVGTPPYMSYEQAKGRRTDARSDLYSLGIVLYEMVTGRPPFVAENPLAVVDMHIRENPVPPTQLNPNLPPYIEHAILCALEKEPRRRWASATELAGALGLDASIPTNLPSAPIGLALIRPDGSAISLTTGVTPLNRREVNPADDLISRRHAQVVYQDGTWWLQDLDSVNGTYVNGIRIFREAVMLHPGDEIQIGRTILRVA